MKSFTSLFGALFVLLGVLCGGAALATYSVSGTVTVTAETTTTSIIYHYAVTNTGTSPIAEFTIGQMSSGPSYTLSELPIGTTNGLNTPDGMETYVLSPSATSQPTGWIPSLSGPDVDEPVKYSLKWTAPDSGIPPGATVSGFSVGVAFVDHLERRSIAENVTQQPYTADVCYLGDMSYINGPVMLGTYFEGYNSTNEWSQVTPTKLDTSAPSLSVSASPSQLSPLKPMVKVQFSANVVDDHDPNPFVCLSAITANQTLVQSMDYPDAVFGTRPTTFSLAATLGIVTSALAQQVTGPRSYSVTYEATDASGNRTSATVPIPVSALPP